MVTKPLEVTRRVQARIPTEWGEFELILYEDNQDYKENLALVRGHIVGQKDVLVRVHSECFTGDVLGSQRCDCGAHLLRAMQVIAEAKAGVLVYLRPKGGGLALLKKLQAYHLQDQGLDTMAANLGLDHHPDERDFDIAALILKDLGVRSIRLLTTNPPKIERLENLGVGIMDRVPLESRTTLDNASYSGSRLEHRPHMALPQSSANFCEDQSLGAKLQEIKSEGADNRRKKGRPLVTLTYAQSLDGSIAARPGHPLTISCSQSRVFTHCLRAVHDAILVGIGTVLADNPRLTVRLVPGESPQPVLLDSRLRFPSYAHLLQDGNRRPWIATTAAAEPGRQDDLERQGALIFRLPVGSCGGIDLAALLAKLGEMGVNSLMVEGGAQVINSFISSYLVDQVIITVAPVLVGGLRAFDSVSRLPYGKFPRLAEVTFHQMGEDLIVWGKPDWESL
ncbi:MAG: GTP cyclohydrolase II RibA [Desulfobacteraceae bacterium]